VKDILQWTVRLKEGDREGLSDWVNWLIQNKFFPKRDTEGDNGIRGGGTSDYGEDIAHTNP
jgi:hypothetical protein